ncbi:MAG TPA: beta-propeller fold lactonase family protein [Candidatus Sulfotelmatobacter sp.]|nr:beta-propeller fold lactonase family protein [Candidatus Sulfotelmatobacter sp.]
MFKAAGQASVPNFVFNKFLEELRMLKKAAALLLVCASIGAWLGCGKTSSRFLYAAIPSGAGGGQIVAYREDPNAGVLNQLSGSPIAAGSAVEALAISSGKYLYAANSGSNNISLYTISSTGGLTEVTPRQPTGTSPTLLVMDPPGSFLYVANSLSNDISVFSIGTGGALTTVQQTGGATAPIGLSAMNMALAPSGHFLYVTGQESQGWVEAFPVSQGVLGTPTVTLTGNNPFGLAIDPAGSHLYTANKLDSSISTFTINSDGSLTQVGTPIGETFTGPVSLLIDKSGKYLYMANQGSSNLAAYTIGSDGGLTLLTGSPFATGAQPSFIASDSSGKYLFVGNQASSAIQSFSLNTGTGALTSIGTYSVPATPTSIVITP